MDDRKSPIQRNAPIPDDFVKLAKRLRPDAIEVMLGAVWQGYDQLRNDDGFTVDTSDTHVEDDISYALLARIQDVLDPFSPFDVVHQPTERERQANFGRAPQSDLGFRCKGGNLRSHLTMEAKVLETDGSVSDYTKEITNNFLTGRYSTYSSEGAMLGYLLSGITMNVFQAIGKALSCELQPCASFPDRDHRCSDHRRLNADLEASDFKCHHMIMRFG